MVSHLQERGEAQMERSVNNDQQYPYPRYLPMTLAQGQTYVKSLTRAPKKSRLHCPCPFSLYVPSELSFLAHEILVRYQHDDMRVICLQSADTAAFACILKQ